MTDVKVEQCDREAAAGTIPDDGSHVSHMMVDAILNGRADDWPLVQAFARHRQAAEQAQQERDAKVAQERAEAYHSIPRVNLLNAARAGEAERIATAIRSHSHE